MHIVQAQPFESRKKWFYENLYGNKPPSNDLILTDDASVIEVDRGKGAEGWELRRRKSERRGAEREMGEGGWSKSRKRGRRDSDRNRKGQSGVRLD